MGRIDEIRHFLSLHRDKLTPQQALNLDEEVLKSWDPDHPEAPTSTESTQEQDIHNYNVGDPDFEAKINGNDPTLRPLYPKANQTAESPSQSSGEAKG